MNALTFELLTQKAIEINSKSSAVYIVYSALVRVSPGVNLSILMWFIHRPQFTPRSRSSARRLCPAGNTAPETAL
jgi:hypothetical protein